MLLHDSLDDAVADVSADLPALVAASRNQGLSIRRRRRALATVGTAAAVTAIAVSGYTLLPGGDSTPGGSAASEIVDPGPLSGQTATITSRGVAAALGAAVGEAAGGAITHYQGDAYEHEAFAALLLQPEAGSGPAGQVMVNVQPLAMGGRAPYSCEGYLPEYLSDCVVRRLPNGDTLRTYHEDGDTEFGARSRRYVAEVLSPTRRLRVIVNAMNTNPWQAGQYREHAVLTTEQLTEVATRPWWNRTQLPMEYVEAGERLDDFADADEG